MIYTSLTAALKDGWSVYDAQYEPGKTMLLRKRVGTQFVLAVCKPGKELTRA